MKLFSKKPKTQALATDQSQLILDTIADAVVMIDAAGVVKLFNPAAVAITGWQPNEAVSLDYRSVLVLVNDKNEPYSPEQHPFSLCLISKTTTKDTNAYLQTRGQKSVAVSIVASVIQDQQGVVTGAVAIIRDVTKERGEEQKRAEFISTASHEMRTPVAAIEGYLSLAMNDRVCHIDAKARDFLDKAHSSTQHLGKLFQDLLTAAKSEDGRLSNHPVVVEMGEYLQGIADDMRFAAAKKHLATDFVIGTGTDAIDATGGQKVVRPLYYCVVDPERIREVITNLFDNAVKYTDEGKVSLGITGNNNLIQIRISDTGSGIPPEDVSHLFQKFYRVDNTATRTIGGTGLGLFICRKIVELYNGKIWVDSTLGKGSTFYINLPRISTQQADILRSSQPTNTISPLGAS